MKKLLTLLALMAAITVNAQCKVVGDTVKINTDKINWLFIDGQLYHIKKSTSLEQYILPNPYRWPSGIILDSTRNTRWYVAPPVNLSNSKNN